MNPIAKATIMNGITDESIAAMTIVLRFSTGPGIVVLDPVNRFCLAKYNYY